MISSKNKISLRYSVREQDLTEIKELLESTGNFRTNEINVAIELIEDRLTKGDSSDYYFIFAECGRVTAGYICYGPILVTDRRYDLYWLAVRRDLQGRAIGSLLLAEAEGRIKENGAVTLFAETSSSALYGPARHFYRRHGFREVARIPDYYADNDDRIVLVKDVRYEHAI